MAGRDNKPLTDRQAVAVVEVVEKATLSERLALQEWASRLLLIRNSELTPIRKARAAIAATASAKVVWPAVRITATKLREVGWDNRSRSARFGLVGAAVGVALAGGQSAGIAALGTAIGVPLWVVFGAGAAFANGLIEEIKRHGNEER